MTHKVEGLGTVLMNKGIFGTLAGGSQPSSGVNDQNALILQSTYENPFVPGQFLDSEITFNNLGVTVELPANDTTGRFLCQNSDGDKVMQVDAGPLNSNAIVSLGIGAGAVNPSIGAIAVGPLAGGTNQGSGAVAIGANAGNSTQGPQAIAIGVNAGSTSQGQGAIAIGTNAGNDTQSVQGIAVGDNAGVTNQGQQAVAIGNLAGNDTQAALAVAIGKSAGNTNQGQGALSIGLSAGESGQGSHATAIGYESGKANQGQESIAIGYQSCVSSGDAGNYSISIGSQSKHTGTYGVSLGYKAGFDTVSAGDNNAFYIGMDGYVNTSTLGQSCMRPGGDLIEDATNQWRLLAINTVTGEVKFITGVSAQALSPGTVEPVTIDINTGEVGHG